MSEQAPAKRMELILQQLDQLPTLPAVAVRVLDVTSDQDSSAREVVELIENDPSLTARILQLVHRADLGVRGDISSVQRAVVFLGFAAVRSAVLAISIFQTFGSGDKQKGHFSRVSFWKHCVAVACCTELLCEQWNQNHGPEAQMVTSEAFVCGLLHDLGKVALDASLPKSFDRVVEAADLLRSNIADVERTVIGLDHMVVGKRLAERWNLPASIRDCVWLHGQLPSALPPTVRSARLVNMVTLADLIVREQHLGYSGNYSFNVPRTVLLEALGLTDKQVHQATERLVPSIEPRARALGLGESTSAQIYQQALSQANRELGRVSGQLAARNRKLAVRAKFFDALSGFQSELRPDAPIQVVLQAIGQTAVGVLEVPAAASFSLPPGQNFAEVMLFDASGAPFETTLVDCPSRPSCPPGGDGPVNPVGEELEWILSAISPRLARDQRFWICLEADGMCMGGVLWGAAAGEGQRLSPQVQELTAISAGWALAMRTSQIREEARALAEQLAESNRQLQNAQSEILRSKTMIAVGEMAAGAAHEMNNPLAIISGRAQLLASQLSSDAKLQHAATTIADQAHRLSGIITELMNYAKPMPPAIAEADLADVVRRGIQQARERTAPADRKIEITMPEVPPLMVDAMQLAGAVTEILDNAIHATDEGEGLIEIHAAHDPYSSRVALTISDNGCGMNEQTLKRAFDPFFSSKPAGRRRGMGLAKALRWIEASGGSMRLESRPDRGTQAIVLLPTAGSLPDESVAGERRAAAHQG